MHRPAVIICFLLGTLNLPGQSLTDSKAAFDLSRRYGKPVFLIFSGSDWCAPCIRFEKNVLTDSSFSDFAGHSLILLKADFPQRKKLEGDVAGQNEALARKYNPDGIFPYFLLLDPNGTVMQRFTYHNESPADLIAAILTCIHHDSTPGIQGSR